MTTGQTLDDSMTAVSTSGGPGKIGSYYSKTWKGDDYPKNTQPPRYMNLYDGVGGVHRKRVKPPKRARVIEHPYTMSLISKADNVMEVSDNTGRSWSTCTFENYFGPPAFTATWTSADQIALLGKLRAEIVGNSFNPAVFLAEGKQALEMIFSSATRLSQGIAAARKGNFKVAARALAGEAQRKQGKGHKTATNWLELQYGWLPLLKDAYDGAQFLAHLSSAPFQTTVSVSRTKRDSATASHIRFLGGECIVSTKIKAVLKEVDIIGLSGLKDPSEVLWEKLPWSFVADWFIPIGNYLAARGLAQSLKGTFVTTTYRRMRVRGKNAKSIYPYFLLRNSAYAYTYVTVDRTVSNSLSVPLPEVKALADVPSWRRAANAVALVTQKVAPALRDRKIYTE